MTFSYSGNPNASILDEVRFLIQDTDEKDFCLSDEEINYLVSKNKTSIHSALAACYVLIAKFSRAIDEQTGKQTIYASQIQNHYQTLCERLEMLSAKKAAQIYIGGINSNSNKRSRHQFNDREGDNHRAWIGDDN